MHSFNKKFLPLLLGLLFIGLLTLITETIKKAGYHISYSATTSMPKGFYLIAPTSKISHNDIIEFIPRPEILEFIKEKKWIPKSGRILKYVFATPGDHVCIKNQKIWINGKKIARIYESYDENKLLPQTKICGKLKSDQYLPLSTMIDRSFDGRYFGAVSSKEILGRAIPIFIYKPK